jgi:hypothetical protein
MWGGFVAGGVLIGLGIGAWMSDVGSDGSMLLMLSLVAGLIAAIAGAALPRRTPAVPVTSEPAIDLRDPVVDLTQEAPAATRSRPRPSRPRAPAD